MSYCRQFVHPLYPSDKVQSVLYCSHIWGDRSPNDISPTWCYTVEGNNTHRWWVPSLKLPSLDHLRAVGDLYLFYSYFHWFCLEELSFIIPYLATLGRSTTASSRMHLYTVQVQKPKTSQFCRSLIPRFWKLWNQLPPLFSSLRLELICSSPLPLQVTNRTSVLKHH